MTSIFRKLATALMAVGVMSAAQAQQAPGDAKKLLSPQNSAVIMIDHQSQMAFAVQSIDRTLLTNNAVALAKTAKAFNVPTVLTTVAEKSFSGPLFGGIKAALPDVRVIDRTTMNSWEDKNFRDAVKKTGKKKLVMSALWTEVCLVMPVLAALEEGYEVYIVTDASGGVTKEAHDMAVTRMVQAGAVPITWMQLLLEYQRDWARQSTYDATVKIAIEHGGAYGTGLEYAKAMLGADAGEGKASKK
jgi:nicotinamidase-related amidase